MDMFKGIALGVILTLVVCYVFGSMHSTAGYLNVFPQTIYGVRIFWSWMLFFASSGLSWALLAMSPK